MDHLLYLRSRYGSVYATELPDGRIIPWRPLTIGEFVEYDSMLRMNQYPAAVIEDEVFQKCVLDEGVVKGMEHGRAGVVSTVTAAIFSVSGPDSPEEMNQVMNFHRMQSGGVFPYIISLITQAFPAYKPEDVYAMDYSTMMSRLAQAEHKLLRMGLIDQPIFFENAQAQQQEQRPPPPRERVDSSQLFEKYYEGQGVKPPPPTRPIPPPPAPAVPSKTEKPVVITETDVAEHTTHYTGHEAEDRIILESNMVNETTEIYGDYVEQMRKGEKVKIPSHEERMAAAKKRAEANRQKALEIARKKKEEELEIQRAVAKAQAKKRAAAKQKKK